MSTSFYKLQATGNDFIFFWAQDGVGPMSTQRITALCSRQTGIGADGLVILHPSTEKDFTHRWEFYNSDGGTAEMCGNAARCATLFLETVFGKKKIKVQTSAGFFSGSRAEDGDIEVVFSLPSQATRAIHNLFGGQFQIAYLTNTGVPHCVIPHEDPWGLKSRAKELAAHIFDKEFSSAGANLTFVNWAHKEKLVAVTLERGVNDFTLSCGTGVIAAAKVYSELNNIGGWRRVITPGGELEVFCLPGHEQVHLKGAAQFVFKGEV